ncbi:SDR family NAD(P)-dependent oxidoreductase [Dactylosporangium sp. CA-139066]|uniref:SDR family NAD(P)-dependent oxidoreductase n=1 Tax=Dactylosporangium sp. CA-139066 TaxID=3239930 RepID=UPI003D902981
MTTKTALVTGANKGIGLEIARGLRALGMDVLIGARDPIRGKEAAAAIGATAVELDVTDEDSIARAASRIEVLDVLVNNAGILLERGAPPSATPVSMLRDTYAVNVFGVVAVTTALLPALRRAPAARIVNLGSGLGSLAYASTPDHVYARNTLLAYNSSKSALSAVTLSFANELRDTAIKVNVADPGYCATDLNGHAGPRTAAQGAVAAIRLATLPDDGPTGRFFDDEGEVPW